MWFKSNPRRANSHSLLFCQKRSIQRHPSLIYSPANTPSAKICLSFPSSCLVVVCLSSGLVCFVRFWPSALTPIRRPTPFPASYRSPRRFLSLLLSSSPSPSSRSFSPCSGCDFTCRRIFRSTSILNRVSLSLYSLGFLPTLVPFASRDAIRRKNTVTVVAHNGPNTKSHPPTTSTTRLFYRLSLD